LTAADTQARSEAPIAPRASDDVAVVLGCRVEDSGEPSGALRRRASWAAAAYRAGLASRIIAAGGRRWGDHVEAEATFRWLVQSGVPEDRILMELCSLTTAENAIFSAPLLRSLSKSRAIVVTCAWHMPRAVACFRAVGIEAIALSAPPPPSTLVTKVRRKVHELLSGRLDRHNFARIAAIRARGDAHPFDREP
jgi:uncharacterized SAM-binding protein YcdF (DUF218 family)